MDTVRRAPDRDKGMTGLVQLWTLAPALQVQVLRARFACRVAFARFIHAHELTGRALRRGRVRYHRAA
jgi:hypothetical protein